MVSDPHTTNDSSLDRNYLDFSCLQGKLYDRSKQETKLLQAYRRLATNEDKKAEFVLISGASGTGKTSLAHILRQPVTSNGGFFISGKFDQLQNPEPYAPLVSAFTELINLVLSKNDQSVDSTKESVEHALQGDGLILVDFIPALGQLSRGRREEVSDLHCSEYLKHFRTVFRRFARAVCSPDHPVVLFMDDLQWADPSSLELICSLITDIENKGMVIVGSCRDDVTHDSHLSSKLRELEEQKVLITNVGVRNLKEQALNDMLSVLLRLGTEQCKPLTKVVFKKTNGNILHVMEFLHHLATAGLLCFDQDTMMWDWDESEIHSTELNEGSSSLVELISDRLSQLPIAVQNVLKIASCIGARFDQLIMEKASSASVSEELKVASDRGLIEHDPLSGIYMFAHDSIQQAAHSRIPEGKRERYYLRIGRTLWKNFSSAELESHVFVVFNQFHKVSHLLKDQNEKHGIASLCLLAGRKAVKSSGFWVASEYLEWGINLLVRESWRDEYNLTLELYNAAAEVEIVTANFERMDELIESVLRNARCFRDKQRAYATEIYSLGSRGQKQAAIDRGLEVLRELGEPFPSKVGPSYVVWDAAKTKRLLKQKSHESLMRLPPMSDPDKLAAMQILNLLFRSTYVERAELVPFIVMRMVRLTIQHGACAASSVGFAEYGMMLCGIRGDVEGGYRYGQLALNLLERFQATEWIPRVYCAYYGGINHWKRPLSLSLAPLKHAHQVGLETGDIDTAMLAINLYQYHSVHCRKSLLVLEKEVRSSHQLMVAYKQYAALGMIRPFWQMLLNLTGQSSDPIVLTGEAFDEEKGLKDAIEGKINTLFMSIHYIKMMLAYFFGEYVLAERMAEGCKDAELLAIGSHTVALVTFFHGMTVLALAGLRKHRKKQLLVSRKCIKKTKRRALHSPETYLDQLLLLEAEYASVSGKDNLARAKYTCAISLSGDTDHGAPLIFALANERAGNHIINRGNDSLAQEYLEKAYAAYEQVGALAKLNYLKCKYPILQGLS